MEEKLKLIAHHVQLAKDAPALKPAKAKAEIETAFKLQIELLAEIITELKGLKDGKN